MIGLVMGDEELIDRALYGIKDLKLDTEEKDDDENDTIQVSNTQVSTIQVSNIQVYNIQVPNIQVQVPPTSTKY